jgi:hypothetical protein
MLYPLLPAVADAPEQIDQLVIFAAGCGADEVFVEPVNPRGPGLKHCQEELELWGYTPEAEAISGIRHRREWSRYCLDLIRNVQACVRRHFNIEKLRFLLYPTRLLPEHETEIRRDDEGAVWLGKAALHRAALPHSASRPWPARERMIARVAESSAGHARIRRARSGAKLPASTPTAAFSPQSAELLGAPFPPQLSMSFGMHDLGRSGQQFSKPSPSSTRPTRLGQTDDSSTGQSSVFNP